MIKKNADLKRSVFFLEKVKKGIDFWKMVC